MFALNPGAARKKIQILGLALLFAFLTDILGFIRIFVFKQMANPVITIGTIFNASAYLLFYRDLFTSKKVQSIIVVILVLYVGLALINIFFIQGLNSFSYTLALRSIALIVVSLFYFYSLGSEHLTQRITQLPMFWINTAVLVYFAGTFFHWLLLDYLLVMTNSDAVMTYTIKNSLGILYYIAVAVALWYNRALYLPKSNPPPDATVQ